MEDYISYKKLNIVLGIFKQSTNVFEDIIVKIVMIIITVRGPQYYWGCGLSPSLTDSSLRV